MGLTLVEKIAARHADGLAPGAVVRAGDSIFSRSYTGTTPQKLQRNGQPMLA